MRDFGQAVLIRKLRTALAIVVAIALGTMMVAYFLYRVNQEDAYHMNPQFEER